MNDTSDSASASATDDNTPNGDFEHVDSEERNLAVQLGVDELAERGQLLAQLGVEIEQLVEDRKAAASEAKAEIDQKNAERVRLQAMVATGEEVRPVTCNKEINWDANAVRFVRTDTGEVVDTRALAADEQQTSLGLEPQGGQADELPPEPDGDDAEGATHGDGVADDATEGDGETGE